MRCALIVTVNRYAHYTPLQYCHVDGHLLRETLVKWCDFDRTGLIRHIKLDRTDAISTPDDLLAHLRALVDEARAAGDHGSEPFLFYFAGHGLYDLPSCSSYLLLPSSHPDDLERSALPVRVLRDTLTELGRPVIQIIDACHSGEAFRGRGVAHEGAAPNLRGFVTDLRQGVERQNHLGWEMLAACDEDEVSYEDDELQHGVFTHALTQAIRDTPPGSDLLLATLKDRVCPGVQTWAGGAGVSQNPVFAARVFGPLPFARRNRLAPLPPRPPPIRPPVTRYHVNLQPGDAAELDVGSYIIPRSPHSPPRHLKLRACRERDAIRYQLVGDPRLVSPNGRSVQPSFHVQPEQVLRGGPYAWQTHLIKCRFDEHQASITSHDLGGHEVEISITIG